MLLSEQYQRQARWRRWPEALAALPPLPGQQVLDLGCAIGDQSALLTAQGARVIGVDLNPELLAVAKARALPGATFVKGDLLQPDGLDLPTVDGIWCSFTAAYVSDLSRFIQTWAAHLKPGGWLALIEIDDFFAHEPLPAACREILAGFATQVSADGRYDFYAGRKLAPTLRRLGWLDVSERVLADDELSFMGPAPPDVLEAWAQRLDRMRGLQALVGSAFTDVRRELLACLASPTHTSQCRVILATARKPGEPARSAADASRSA